MFLILLIKHNLINNMLPKLENHGGNDIQISMQGTWES